MQHEGMIYLERNGLSWQADLLWKRDRFFGLASLWEDTWLEINCPLFVRGSRMGMFFATDLLEQGKIRGFYPKTPKSDLRY